MSDETFEKLSKNARAVLKESQRIAQEQQTAVTGGHLLLAIIEVPGTLSHDILREYSVNYDQISLVLNLNRRQEIKNKAKISDEIKQILKEGYRVAARFKHFAVDTEHLLVALLSDKNFESYQAVLKVGANPDQIRSQIINIFEDLLEMDEMIRRQAAAPQGFKREVPQQEEGPNNFFQSPVSTMPPIGRKVKALEYFAYDLVAKAKDKKIDPVIGREMEIDRCIQILLRKSKNNPVFIGDPGVGKTAIVEGLALKIAQRKVPLRLSVRRIYQLDLGLLVAGTIYRGQFEERLKNVLREVIQDKSSILFIDEVHSIVGTGSAEGSMDAANLLKPALSKGEIRMIGATTIDEYRKFIEKDTALERRLQPIIVKEPSLNQTVEILNGIKEVYEQHHKVKYDDEAIEAAVKLSSIYINDRFLPDKAIDLIDEAAALKTVTGATARVRPEDDLAGRINEISALKERLILEEKFERAAKVKAEETRLKAELEKTLRLSRLQTNTARVTAADVAKIVSQISGVPVGVLSEEESKKLSNIEKNLGQKIVGQKEAIKEIAKALRRNRAGISTALKPMGSFVFIGPSGVGKTELARVLSEQLFAHNSLIKIDMSEFMERHNTARLVGAPPGYVGYEDAGKLTEKVRKNPYSVVLFDEIEKAHVEVFNLLLQILDCGELTDAKGRNVNFKNTIIIMTSNVGLEEFDSLKRIGFKAGEGQDESALEGRVSEHLYELFKPEFINRIDKIVFFNPLKDNDLKQIAKIHLEKLTDNLKEQNIYIGMSPSILKKILKKDYDIVFGARPLIRTIEDEVETFLSDKIISGEIEKQRKYLLEFKNGKYRLKKIETELIEHLAYLKKDELERVKKAILFARRVHKIARRLSGEPYIIHPLKTALRLADLKLDSTSIIAAILHDTVEDTEANYWQIRIQFGKDVANLVESVTKLETIRIKKGWFPLIGISQKKLPEFEKQVETLRKMLVAMSRDIRVILIKLADKIHNLETLEHLPKEKRERIAREVIEIYAPIAHRLGMGQWKGHLEDLAFPYILPDEYNSLKKLAVPEIKEREEYLKILVGKIKKLLAQNKIKAKTDFRAKRWFSLYKKLQKYDGDLSKIYDLIAVRIIVNSVEDCYSTLGLIHSVWRPLVGRIKDYIALPKPNGYKSIHTTVFADGRKIVEIQIRTNEMHLQGEFGVAAHWVYSENKFSRQPNAQEFKWLQDFYKIQKTVNSTDELLQSFKLDLFEDRIFVFTPDGDVRDLPQGATPIDFAYSIHSDIGNRCAMAKINNKIAPIDAKLENGNIVEIITKKKAKPHRDWLKFVKTQAARSQIRRAIGDKIA